MLKRLNIYTIISIITLCFMMFMLVRTLHVIGWFDEVSVMSPAEQIFTRYSGKYVVLSEGDSTDLITLDVRPSGDPHDEWSLTVYQDSLVSHRLVLNDFEDEQVLVEIFTLEGEKQIQRLEGCELLLRLDSDDAYTGTTIGDFCGLEMDSAEYLALALKLSGPFAEFEIQKRKQGQGHFLMSSNYRFERISSW